MLKIYSDASDRDIKEAERLLEIGLQLRENAIAVSDRAAEIAGDLARFLDTSG